MTEELELSEERLEHYNVSQERAEELKQKVLELDEETENAEETVEKAVKQSTELDIPEALVMQGYIKRLHKKEFVKAPTELKTWQNWFKENREKIREVQEPVAKGDVR